MYVDHGPFIKLMMEVPNSSDVPNVSHGYTLAMVKFGQSLYKVCPHEGNNDLFIPLLNN